MNRQLLYSNITEALKSIRSQKLRAALTIAVIAVGITALVGILTAISSIKTSLNSNFSSMGANTLNIQKDEPRGHQREKGKEKENLPITYIQAQTFKKRFHFPAKVSISGMASVAAVAQFRNKKTNPNVALTGGGENYLYNTGYTLKEGRNFSFNEVNNGALVCIIGHDIEEKLFETTYPMDKIIGIEGKKYRVIGVLKKKGSSFGFSGDRTVIIPLKTLKHAYASSDKSYVISIKYDNPTMMDATKNTATGILRVIRGEQPGEENSFAITSSDNLANMLIDKLKYVTLAATIIGVITLLGAAIGLMNIMLVSVTERTKEIGTRKAIGASSVFIKNQFLIEALTICQLGGIAGIILGILIGNIVSVLMHGSFVVPWNWIIMGVLLCFIVGVISGYYPAKKASRLEPIDALRYE